MHMQSSLELKKEGVQRESSTFFQWLVLTPRVEGMKDWPPNPGLTLMRRMMSTLSITYLQ